MPTNRGIKNEGQALAQIQIAFSTSYLHMCFSVANHYGGCPVGSSRTGEWAQMAPHRPVPRRTRSGRGGRAGRLDNLLFWLGEWRGLENNRCRSCLDADL